MAKGRKNRVGGITHHDAVYLHLPRPGDGLVFVGGLGKDKIHPDARSLLHAGEHKGRARELQRVLGKVAQAEFLRRGNYLSRPFWAIPRGDIDNPW